MHFAYLSVGRSVGRWVELIRFIQTNICSVIFEVRECQVSFRSIRIQLILFWWLTDRFVSFRDRHNEFFFLQLNRFESAWLNAIEWIGEWKHSNIHGGFLFFAFYFYFYLYATLIIPILMSIRRDFSIISVFVEPNHLDMSKQCHHHSSLCWTNDFLYLHLLSIENVRFYCVCCLDSIFIHGNNSKLLFAVYSIQIISKSHEPHATWVLFMTLARMKTEKSALCRYFYFVDITKNSHWKMQDKGFSSSFHTSKTS